MKAGKNNCDETRNFVCHRSSITEASVINLVSRDKSLNPELSRGNPGEEIILITVFSL